MTSPSRRFPPCLLCLAAMLGAPGAGAQSASERAEDEAVGASINYVFATDLGSGVYDLDGRTLQIYQLTYEKELRDTSPEQFGVRLEVPFTFGFFDFKPTDVLSNGLPTRVDSFSVVPGFELEFPVSNGWHFVPYARAGFSVASSSVDGWLYGLGLRLERSGEFHGWDSFVRSELALAGVEYRQEAGSDQFLRARQGFDLTRALDWKIRDRAVELGLYAMVDFVLDPPTVPVTTGRQQPLQAEIGFTFATRPRIKIWRWDAPRLGFGYRFAQELSAWRLVIGTPF